MIQLGKHFRSDEKSRHSDWLRRRQWFIKARRDNARQEKIADGIEDDVLSLATETVIATQIQIEDFQARIDTYEARLNDYDTKLDIYDAAVTRALMERLQRLEVLEANHAELLANAFTLEDGTRVFKSEDGTFVINEKGQKLGADVIDPKTIPDSFTTAKELTTSFAAMDEENTEIGKLYTAQGAIDIARDKSKFAGDKIGSIRKAISKDGITVGELDNLGAEIDAIMPTELPSIPGSAMKYVFGIDTIDNAPNAKTAFSANATPAVTKLQPATNTPKLEPTG